MTTNQKRVPRQEASAALAKFNFHGDELDVVKMPDGQHYVVLARLCEPFNLKPHDQALKLRSLPWATTRIIRVVAEDGKSRDVVCLSIRSVSGWLFTLNAGKVAAHLRDKLALYQRECADVLADHFLGARRTQSGMTVEQIFEALAPFMKSMQAQSDRLAALEEQVRNGSTMAAERASAIKARVKQCVDELARYGVEKKRKASLRIHKRLKMKVGWYGDFCRLNNMPARHEADLLRELEIVEHETNGAVAAARQLKLPHLELVANTNRKKAAS